MVGRVKESCRRVLGGTPLLVRGPRTVQATARPLYEVIKTVTGTASVRMTRGEVEVMLPQDYSIGLTPRHEHALFLQGFFFSTSCSLC
jgi:hypothetical protein